MWACVWLLATPVGCADLETTQTVRRGPAGFAPNAGFSEEEKNLCWDYECRHFVAPCSLTDPTRKLSLLEERYVEESQSFREHGYCPQPPRQLSPEFYANDTCLFIFVKEGQCP